MLFTSLGDLEKRPVKAHMQWKRSASCSSAKPIFLFKEKEGKQSLGKNRVCDVL